jgi:hypothetical protein
MRQRLRSRHLALGVVAAGILAFAVGASAEEWVEPGSLPPVGNPPGFIWLQNTQSPVAQSGGFRVGGVAYVRALIAEDGGISVKNGAALLQKRLVGVQAIGRATPAENLESNSRIEFDQFGEVAIRPKHGAFGLTVNSSRIVAPQTIPGYLRLSHDGERGYISEGQLAPHGISIDRDDVGVAGSLQVGTGASGGSSSVRLSTPAQSLYIDSGGNVQIRLNSDREEGGTATLGVNNATNQRVLTVSEDGSVVSVRDVRGARLCIAEDCRDVWPSGEGGDDGGGDPGPEYDGAVDLVDDPETAPAQDGGFHVARGGVVDGSLKVGGRLILQSDTITRSPPSNPDRSAPRIQLDDSGHVLISSGALGEGVRIQAKDPRNTQEMIRIWHDNFGGARLTLGPSSISYGTRFTDRYLSIANQIVVGHRQAFGEYRLGSRSASEVRSLSANLFVASPQDVTVQVNSENGSDGAFRVVSGKHPNDDYRGRQYAVAFSVTREGSVRATQDVGAPRLCIGSDCRNEWPDGGAEEFDISDVVQLYPDASAATPQGGGFSVGNASRVTAPLEVSQLNLAPSGSMGATSFDASKSWSKRPGRISFGNYGDVAVNTGSTWYGLRIHNAENRGRYANILHDGTNVRILDSVDSRDISRGGGLAVGNGGITVANQVVVHSRAIGSNDRAAQISSLRERFYIRARKDVTVQLDPEAAHEDAAFRVVSGEGEQGGRRFPDLFTVQENGDVVVSSSRGRFCFGIDCRAMRMTTESFGSNSAGSALTLLGPLATGGVGGTPFSQARFSFANDGSIIATPARLNGDRGGEFRVEDPNNVGAFAVISRDGEGVKIRDSSSDYVLEIEANTGAVRIPRHLCLGGVCRNTWPEGGGGDGDLTGAVQLQASTPGTQQIGHANVNGTLQAGRAVANAFATTSGRLLMINNGEIVTHGGLAFGAGSSTPGRIAVINGATALYDNTSNGIRIQNGNVSVDRSLTIGARTDQEWLPGDTYASVNAPVQSLYVNGNGDIALRIDSDQNEAPERANDSSLRLRNGDNQTVFLVDEEGNTVVSGDLRVEGRYPGSERTIVSEICAGSGEVSCVASCAAGWIAAGGGCSSSVDTPILRSVPTQDGWSCGTDGFNPWIEELNGNIVDAGRNDIIYSLIVDVVCLR